MSRDNIVSVRLTDDELAALLKLGRASDVLRDLLREKISPRPATRWLHARGHGSISVASGANGSPIIWNDGTASCTYPLASTA